MYVEYGVYEYRLWHARGSNISFRGPTPSEHAFVENHHVFLSSFVSSSCYRVCSNTLELSDKNHQPQFLSQMHRRSCDPKRWFEWGTAGDEWRWPSEFDMQLWQSTRESGSPPATPGFNRFFFWNSNWWVCGISASQVAGKMSCVYTR